MSKVATKQIMMGACYSCTHRGTVPYDAHSCCHHPEGAGLGGLVALTLAIMNNDGNLAKRMLSLGIRCDRHGFESGWFMWPANFDPVWLENCDGYTNKDGLTWDQFKEAEAKKKEEANHE